MEFYGSCDIKTFDVLIGDSIGCKRWNFYSFFVVSNGTIQWFARRDALNHKMNYMIISIDHMIHFIDFSIGTHIHYHKIGSIGNILSFLWLGCSARNHTWLPLNSAQMFEQCKIKICEIKLQALKYCIEQGHTMICAPWCFES